MNETTYDLTQYNNQNIILSLDPSKPTVVVGAKQGDNQTRILKIQIDSAQDVSEPSIITDYTNKEVSYRIRRPDSIGIWNVAAASGSQVIVTLNSTDLGVAGRCYADVAISSGDQLISTNGFVIEVEPSPNIIDSVKTSNQFGYLISLLTEAKWLITLLNNYGDNSTATATMSYASTPSDVGVTVQVGTNEFRSGKEFKFDFTLPQYAIESAAISSDGHLILYPFSGNPIDAGYVVGPAGAAGIASGDYVFSAQFSNTNPSSPGVAVEASDNNVLFSFNLSNKQNVAYYSSAAPTTGLTDGDLWFDTSVSSADLLVDSAPSAGSPHLISSGAVWNGLHLKADVNMLANTFSSTVTYSKNDCCTYNGQLYKCITDEPRVGPWNAADFQITTVMTMINTFRNSLNSVLIV